MAFAMQPPPPQPPDTGWRDDLVMADTLDAWAVPRLAPSLRQQRQESFRKPRSFGLASVKETSTDDFLLRAILDEALEPPRTLQSTLGPQGLAPARAPTPQNFQESKDDAALARILGSPLPKPKSSAALRRLLGTMERNEEDGAPLSVVGARKGTLRRERDPLSQVLESLAPADDLALAALEPTLRKLPRSLLLSQVADLMEKKSAQRRSRMAEVVLGGRGRGGRSEQLCQPVGLAVASHGDIFVADCGNCRVLRFNAHFQLTGSLGGKDGFGWFSPIDLAYSEAGAGALLVSAERGVQLADFEAQSLALAAEGCLPSGLALEAGGSLLFADAYDHCVVRCTWRGTCGRQVVCGAQPGEKALGQDAARLHRPFGLAVDAEAMYIADSGNHRVLRWRRGASCGEVVAGGNGRGGGLHQLSYPRGIALEPDAVLVADTFNHRVVRWRRNCSKGELVFGARGRQLDQLNKPTALAFLRPGRRLLIADSGNHRVLSVNL